MKQWKPVCSSEWQNTESKVEKGACFLESYRTPWGVFCWHTQAHRHNAGFMSDIQWLPRSLCRHTLLPSESLGWTKGRCMDATLLQNGRLSVEEAGCHPPLSQAATLIHPSPSTHGQPCLHTHTNILFPWDVLSFNGFKNPCLVGAWWLPPVIPVCRKLRQVVMTVNLRCLGPA